MGLLAGLIIGAVAGVLVGKDITRKKRLRQIEAALKEGRVKLVDNNGGDLDADGFSVILDDEFRDA